LKNIFVVVGLSDVTITSKWKNGQTKFEKEKF